MVWCSIMWPWPTVDHCILSSIDNVIRCFSFVFFTPDVVIKKNKIRFKMI